MARSGDEARTALLNASERLFALQGVETASLRDIAVEAGQRNNSAVQYHFGDREGLVAAVFTRRMDAINELRRTMIRDLDVDHRGDDIVGLVAALMFPLVGYVTTHDGWYGRFLVRTEFDHFATTVKNALPVSGPVREIMQRLVNQLTDVEPRVRQLRVEQMMTHYIGTVADWEWARERGARRMTTEALRQDLLATCVAILTAPAKIHTELSIKEMK
jgi:AcrR family transcriptional regulator